MASRRTFRLCARDKMTRRKIRSVHGLSSIEDIAMHHAAKHVHLQLLATFLLSVTSWSSAVAATLSFEDLGLSGTNGSLPSTTVYQDEGALVSARRLARFRPVGINDPVANERMKRVSDLTVILARVG